MSNLNSTVSSGENGPFRGLSPDNQSGVIAILSAFGFSLILLSVPVRLYVRGKYSTYGADDASYFAAALVAVGQFSAIFYQLGLGLGQADIHLHGIHQSPRLKAAYASNILYIVALFFSKLSTASLLLRLTPTSSHRYAIWGTICITIIWAISSIFMLAFRCNSSKPWLDVSAAQCPDLLVRWQYITALDIITEVFIFSIVILIVWNIQMPSVKKSQVVCAFAGRVLTIIIAALHLYYLVPLIARTAPSSNISLLLAPAIACAQIQVGYSILASIIPYLKNLMAAFDQDLSTAYSQELTPYSKKGTVTVSSEKTSPTMTDEREWLHHHDEVRKPPATSFPRMHNPKLTPRFDPTPTLYEALVVGPGDSNRPMSSGYATIEEDEDPQRMTIKKGVEWSVDYDRLSGRRSPTLVHKVPPSVGQEGVLSPSSL